MAYCPKICDFDKQFDQFCPVTLIAVMHARGFFLRSHRKVMHDVLTPKSLCAYIVSLTGRGLNPVQTALIKTHSLRIGGHTYFTAMGMNPDLTNYLGRRKVKDITSLFPRFRTPDPIRLQNIFHHVTPTGSPHLKPLSCRTQTPADIFPIFLSFFI